MSANSAPGWKTYPNHRIVAKPAGARVQVTVNGKVIADTRDAIRVDEDGYPTVYYIPRGDVRMERLERSDHRSTCPFKGEASYYSIVNGPANAVWSYEQPYDEMAVIRELLAFYPDKVDSIAVG
jgi:uncharacterized protein (DUF427 family)